MGWEDVCSDLREMADRIEYEAPVVKALEAAARDALEALVAIQDKDDGSLVSPARNRLSRALDVIDGKIEPEDLDS